MLNCSCSTTHGWETERCQLCKLVSPSFGFLLIWGAVMLVEPITILIFMNSSKILPWLLRSPLWHRHRHARGLAPPILCQEITKSQQSHNVTHGAWSLVTHGAWSLVTLKTANNADPPLHCDKVFISSIICMLMYRTNVKGTTLIMLPLDFHLSRIPEKQGDVMKIYRSQKSITNLWENVDCRWCRRRGNVSSGWSNTLNTLYC